LVVVVSILTAIAIKESAKVGDQASRRAAKGVDDLGKYFQGPRGFWDVFQKRQVCTVTNKNVHE